MITDIMYVTVYVTDQDRALEFYVGGLGLEKHVDYPGPDGRFLTVGAPGSPVRIILWSHAPAPRGLGHNPRDRQIRAMGLEEFADPLGTRDVHGCPSGTTKKDNYCFYRDRDFGGDRWQFADTCADQASDWGFSLKTSSWVNTDTDKTIIAYGGNTRLWDEPENSVSRYVGDANNDKMTRWDCRRQ